MTTASHLHNTHILEGTVAADVAAALARHGVTRIFGQSLPSALLLACPSYGIEQICYRTENAGGAMADGFARVSGKVGVVAAQNGPAATLLVPPLCEAKAASVPVVALVQDVPMLGRDRNAFQELNHFRLFNECAKWIRRLDDPSRAPEYIDMAFTAATSGRPGPAVLLLPKDVLVKPAGQAVRIRKKSLGSFPLDRPRPCRESVERAAGLLAAARRPLIIAGGGVHLSGAAEALAALQQESMIPVGTTVMGKGAVSEDDALSLGVVGYAMGRGAPAHHLTDFIRRADVVLLVGTRTNENGTDGWKLYPDDAAYIHLDASPEEPGRNYESIRLIGDARSGLEDLKERLHQTGLQTRRAGATALKQEIAEARDRSLEAVLERTEDNNTPIRPEKVMAEIGARLDANDILVADASYSSIWVAQYIRAQRPGQRFLTPRGIAGLGWGLPLAIGAKVARPQSRVICVCGDGGFGHVWSEVETAARCRLPLTLVVLNNGILGYQKHSELYQFGAYTNAINFHPVDHAALARACGAEGIRVEQPDDIGPALDHAVTAQGPVLLDVTTRPDAYPPISSWDDSEDLILSL